MELECEICGQALAVALADGMPMCGKCQDVGAADSGKDQSYHRACLLFQALENMLGDWYSFCLNEISREDINEGSSRAAMKLLKRLQWEYRAEDMKPLAIGQKRN